MPTIKDVARAANCSTATVSRALASPEKVTASTRERVNRAIAEVGYSPNVAARNLRRSESRTIVILLPDISNPFFSAIINGMEDVAHSAGYQVLIGDCDLDPSRAEAYFSLLPTNQADGIILLTSDVPAVLVQQAHRRPDFPLVMACEFYDDIELPTVCIDNFAAARHAIDYLQSLGHSRIGSISGPLLNPICRERVKGYQTAMKEAGQAVAEPWMREGDFSFHSGYQQGLQLLENAEQRPTAVFCHSDEMAIGVLKAARQLNLDVPGDLSVIGFDNIGFSEYCEPELTTISQPRNDIGQQAMKNLLDIIGGKQVAPRQILSTQLIVRESTGRAPAV